MKNFEDPKENAAAKSKRSRYGIYGLVLAVAVSLMLISFGPAEQTDDESYRTTGAAPLTAKYIDMVTTVYTAEYDLDYDNLTFKPAAGNNIYEIIQSNTDLLAKNIIIQNNTSVTLILNEINIMGITLMGNA